MRDSLDQPQAGIPGPESAAGDPWISSRLRKSLQLCTFITLPFHKQNIPRSGSKPSGILCHLPLPAQDPSGLGFCVVCSALCSSAVTHFSAQPDLQTRLQLSPRASTAQGSRHSTLLCQRHCQNLQSCTLLGPPPAAAKIAASSKSCPV